MAKLSAEMAKKYLSDVAPEVEFWVCDNRRLKNLAELAEALQTMSDETFAYHSNAEKTDFSNWVRDCIGDTVLAEQLKASKSRLAAYKKVKDRIASLTAIAKRK